MHGTCVKSDSTREATRRFGHKAHDVTEVLVFRAVSPCSSVVGNQRFGDRAAFIFRGKEHETQKTTPSISSP
jgi:hypothetical protein